MVRIVCIFTVNPQTFMHGGTAGMHGGVTMKIDEDRWKIDAVHGAGLHDIRCNPPHTSGTLRQEI